MDKINHLFLKRINVVLDGRPKHPWGDALGFRNARIQSIFQGITPTADALYVIHRAEKVRLDWLVAEAEGPPFAVNDWMSDETVASVIAQPDKTRYLITDGERLMVVTTEQVRFEIKKKFANFKEVNVYPIIGFATIEILLKHQSDLQYAEVSADIFTKIATGWLGPAQMLETTLKQAESAKGLDIPSMAKRALTDLNTATAKREQAAHAAFLIEEQAIIDKIKRLTPVDRQAFLTILDNMTSNV